MPSKPSEEQRKWQSEFAASGGRAAAAKLTPEERSARARKMNEARWSKPNAFTPPNLTKKQRKDRAKKAAAARWAKKEQKE